MRPAIALIVGAAIAFGSAVVLGEYAFSGLVPYFTALVVPALIIAAASGIDRPRPARWWLAGAALGGGGIALGVWFADGRGLQPWPSGGTVAVVLGAAWPLAVAGLRAWRRRRQPAPAA